MDTQASAWKAFTEGALRPSAQALAITLAVPALLFLCCLVFITPALMAGNVSAWFSSGAWDDYTDLTSDAIAISLDRERTPMVMILGASDTRESMRDHALIADRVFDRTGISPEIHNFASSDQTLWEMAALVEQINPERPAVIVMGMGAGRLAIGPDRLAEIVANPRLGFRSATFDAEAGLQGIEPGWRSGNYFLDNASFFLARMIQFMENVVDRHPRQRRFNLYEGNAPVSDERWVPFTDIIHKRHKGYTENADENFRVLARILDRLEGRPLHRAAILLPPKNPRDVADGLWEEIYLHNIDRMQAFTNRHGVPFWRLDAAAGIKLSDFYDASHVNNPDAQNRYRDVLAGRIAGLFEDIPAHRSTP